MKILVVVDMIKAFAQKGGSLYFPAAEEIIPFVKEKIDEYLERGDQILLLCDDHLPDDKEFKRFGEHAVSGTEDADPVEALAYIMHHKNVTWIGKTRYSAFFDTILEDIIDFNDWEEATFEFAGVCTGICVMDTVGDFANRDLKTAVYRDGVADLPVAAYLGTKLPIGITDENLKELWLGRMSFLYGTKIL